MASIIQRLAQVNGWRGTSPSEVSVNTAMDAAIHTSLPTFGAATMGDTLAWRPKGILATHLVEHKKAVNKIAVASNGAFFVTVSDDETAKVWDCRRLEKDVTFRSRLTYAPKVFNQLDPFFVQKALTSASLCHDCWFAIWKGSAWTV